MKRKSIVMAVVVSAATFAGTWAMAQSCCGKKGAEKPACENAQACEAATNGCDAACESGKAATNGCDAACESGKAATNGCGAACESGKACACKGKKPAEK